MGKTGLKLTKMTDAELIKLAMEENQGAYLMLYNRYEFGVKKHISELINKKEDIDDICVESFEKAFRKLEKYDSQFQFSTWLYAIAYNTALDHIIRSNRKRNNMATTSISNISSLKDLPKMLYDDIPDDDIIKQQEYDKLMANIEKLKEEYRTIAKMRIIDNLAYQEIAEELDMPLNTVKTRISRARVQLTKMMDLSDELL